MRNFGGQSFPLGGVHAVPFDPMQPQDRGQVLTRMTSCAAPRNSAVVALTTNSAVLLPAEGVEQAATAMTGALIGLPGAHAYRVATIAHVCTHP